jgi:hypothetical protein
MRKRAVVVEQLPKVLAIQPPAARRALEKAVGFVGTGRGLESRAHCREAANWGGLLIGRHGRNLSAFAFEGEHLSVRVVRMWFPSDKAHGPFTSRTIGVAS